MTRILITGMSGTGKSAVVQELRARGLEAVDLDTPEWSEWVETDASDSLTPEKGRDWVWREDRVRALLLKPEPGILFVSGCAGNMGRVFALIDKIILLSAPIAVVMERLETRSTGGYGSTAHERAKIRELIATIEPLLRESAHHEVDTDRPVHETVEEILRLSGAVS